MAAASNANVQSIDAIRDVRVTLISFKERANTAFDDLRSKIERTLAWLEQDRPAYWRDQERRAYDRVASTRVSYETCRMRTVGGRHPECIEERIAFDRAKQRLALCRSKMEVVRRWCVEASHQADEFRARSAAMKTMLDEDIPNTIALLSRLLASLEAYAGIGNELRDEAAVSLDANSPALEATTTDLPVAAKEATEPTLEAGDISTEDRSLESMSDTDISAEDQD